uniref:Protein UNC80 C-terminal domain-containing protein n=1 Tax=Romanomermis culicivorax TaxID=13658 RepID=A0A915HGU3_ROMCU
MDLAGGVSRMKSTVCESPQVFEREETIIVRTDTSKPPKSPAPITEATEGMDMQRDVFRRPRDALLSLSAVFFKSAIARIKELSKSVTEHTKTQDMIDQKSYIVSIHQNH